MRSIISKLRVLVSVSLIALILAATGCRPAAESSNDSNLAANTNSAPANVNASAPTESLSAIAAREPEKYRATLVFSAETAGGDKTIGIPTISAQVARNAIDRRVAFKLPDGSDLIYIDHDNHHYAILPGRKQYAELTPEAIGFQLLKLMTPGQIVAYLQNLKGIDRVGEETLNGRAAEKYRYTKTVKTETQAGEVKNEAYVYVDKETGLPLRSELFAEASGEVKGMKSAKIVAELREISTDVDPSSFDLPTGYSKIPPEQIRAQIDAVTGTVATVIKALMANANTAPAASPGPGASPSPTASVKP